MKHELTDHGEICEQLNLVAVHGQAAGQRTSVYDRESVGDNDVNDG